MGGAWTILILGTLQGFQCQTVHVFQIPVVFTPVGGSATLPCEYNISGEVLPTSGFYTWYRQFLKTGPEVSESNEYFTGRVSRVDAHEFINSRSASIILHGAVASDAGMYYCDVTFFDGHEIGGHGSGTFLNVTALETLPYNPWSVPLMFTRVTCFIVSFFVFGCWCLKKQATRSKQEVSGPVLYTDLLKQAEYRGP